MIVTTTNNIEGKKIVQYLGIVTGEAVIGANIFRDFLAAVRDIVGGRSRSYESALREARIAALEDLIEEGQKLGADAIVGASIDFETGLHNGSMLMVAGSGTAVKLG